MGSGIFGRGKNKITPASTGRNSPTSEQTKGINSLVFNLFL